MPFGRKDRDAGYWRECSMRQVEVSRTLVFDAPRRARWFFEALIGDNLDIGCHGRVHVTADPDGTIALPGTSLADGAGELRRGLAVSGLERTDEVAAVGELVPGGDFRHARPAR